MYLNVKKQTGLGLPLAIFVITIMSLVAVAVNRLNESSGQNYVQNVLSTRAFYAAESGMQLRLQQVLTIPSCSCGAQANVDYSFTQAGLSGCTAYSSCSSFIVDGTNYCTVTSRATCDGTNAERTVEVRVK